LGADGREDAGPAGKAVQLGSNGRLEIHLTEALTLATGGRGASTYGLSGGTWTPGKQSWEASAGFALRPPKSERVNVFGRYALTQERTDATTTDPRMVQLSHMIAFTVLVNVFAPLDVGPKVYYRYTTLDRATDDTVDSALIVALRADWHLVHGLDASVEGRGCNAIASSLPARYGALVEASALAIEWLRLGAGYNLSTIATDSVHCDEPGARGMFVRAEVVY